MKRIVLLLSLLAVVAVIGAPAGGGSSTGRYIVVLEDSASLSAVVADHSSLTGARIGHTYSHALNGYVGDLAVCRRRDGQGRQPRRVPLA